MRSLILFLLQGPSNLLGAMFPGVFNLHYFFHVAHRVSRP